MKKLFLLLPVLLLSVNILAQQDFNDSIANSRNRITEKAMIVLGSWAAVNITSGFIIAGQSQGESKYFWQMNAYWNLINGGLAVMGYLGARKAMAKKYGLAENESAQLSIEKLYAFNFGLDLAYIATGFFPARKGIKYQQYEITRTTAGLRNQYYPAGRFFITDGWHHVESSS